MSDDTSVPEITEGMMALGRFVMDANDGKAPPQLVAEYDGAESVRVSRADAPEEHVMVPWSDFAAMAFSGAFVLTMAQDAHDAQAPPPAPEPKADDGDDKPRGVML